MQAQAPQIVGELHEKLHVALDELRMQMLGTQVLFGFQMEGAFQDSFKDLPPHARWADFAALALMVLTIGLLLSAPSQLRLVARGQATQSVMKAATRFANAALLPFSLALGCDMFAAARKVFSLPPAIAAGALASLAATGAWYVLGIVARSRQFKEAARMQDRKPSPTPLHVRIDQMLTESRVILPGAQALLGFQFVVTMTSAFDDLPRALKILHFAALSCDALAVVFLIAPAAIHRLGFDGEDSERFFRIGSRIITVALMPLACAIAADFYVAANIMIGDASISATGAIAAGLVLIALWYALPALLRARNRGP